MIIQLKPIKYFKKIITVTDKALIASFKIAEKIVQ